MDHIDQAIKRMRYLEAETGVAIANDYQPELWDGEDNIAVFFVLATLINQIRDEVARPRAQRFGEEHEDITTVAQLHTLLESMSNHDIARDVLDWGWRNFTESNYRPQLLRDLVDAFLTYQQNECPNLSEQDAMYHWAKYTPDGKSNPFTKVRYCGPKLVAWMKTYGAGIPQIMKDTHTLRGIEEALGLKWQDTPELIDRLGITDYQLDQFFTWIMQKRYDIRELMKEYKA